MSFNKEKAQEEERKFHKIRITLTSTKVKQLEKGRFLSEENSILGDFYSNIVSADIVNRAKASALAVKGPVRLPTKVLKITTRKTPNGEGSKTWDTYELRIHKRLIDLNSPAETVKKITSINIEAGVDVEVTIAA